MILTKLEECLNSYALEFTKEYVKGATELSSYVYAPYPHHGDPLDVEFFWDEEGFGKIASVNLREEYLEKFNDDPEHYALTMPAVVLSLRNLADEIEKIYQSVQL